MQRLDLRRAWRFLPVVPGLVLGTAAVEPATVLASGAPNISSVTPTSGTGCGGDAVTIHGNGFGSVTTVTFGGVASPKIVTQVGNQIVAVSPPHAPGTVDVVVSGGGKTSPVTSADHFTFTAGIPVLTSVSPSLGPPAGGTLVTINGSCLGNTTGVSFGATPASSFAVDNNNQVSAVSPAGTPGTVQLTVSTAQGSASLPFTYVQTPGPAPTVASVTPSSSAVAGGNVVTVTGTGFFGGTASCNVSAVEFGDMAANLATMTSCSDTTITITVPAAVQPGSVDVTVTTSLGGTSVADNDGSPTVNDDYTYLETYFFAWYDHSSSPGFIGDNIHVLNTSPTVTANVIVHIPGCAHDQADAVAPLQEGLFNCSSGYGGPATVASDSPVLVSQRVQYYQSFNEVPAMPSNAAAKNLQFAWYDHVSGPGFTNDNDNIHVINPGATDANVTVTIPGCAPIAHAVLHSSYFIFNCPTGFGGPVTVSSDQPVLASQRIQFFQSFNEEWGQAAGNASTSRDYTWYDHTSSVGFIGDNIHVWNPTGALTPANVTISIQQCSPSVTQFTASELIYTCPFGHGYGGPVTITSTVPVLSSQRVQYYNTFNEVPAVDPSVAADTLYFTWYDHYSDPGFLNGNDNIHVVNVSGTTANVDVIIPGCANPVVMAIVPGTEQLANQAGAGCSTGYGGPVLVSSDQPVLASQRVQYYQSFNEVLGSP